MAEFLESLRWKEDMLVTNHFGDRVWLKPCIQDGKRIGITDCCFAEEPCERHAERTAEQHSTGESL
jgi:hypothetical protein